MKKIFKTILLICVGIIITLISFILVKSNQRLEYLLITNNPPKIGEEYVEDKNCHDSAHTTSPDGTYHVFRSVCKYTENVFREKFGIQRHASEGQFPSSGYVRYTLLDNNNTILEIG